MTTNAGPEYFAAQQKYQDAKTTQDRLFYLKEMLKYAPKHKSSENMVAEITRKIAKFKKDLEKEKEQQSKRGSGSSLNVKKEGAGQIVILGAPNSGKSYLLRKLTGVDVEIAPYPFTTTKPEIGMMNYRGARTQLVEVPAIIEGSSMGRANGTQLLGLARNADAIIIMHRDENERKIAVNELANSGIIVERWKPRITILQHPDYNGITIAGKKFLKMPEKQLVEVLKAHGIHKASVLLEEETDLRKFTEALDESLDYKNCLFIKTLEGVDEEALKAKVFALLEKIIIYTKKPGAEPDLNDPLALKKGATVSDVAKLVHKDIAKNIKYARVWGSAKYPGQRVSKQYRLRSGDVIEISA